jgi:predicted DNA-binding protein
VIRTSFFLKEEYAEDLKKLSEKTGAPVAELMRRAIKEYLKDFKKDETTKNTK